MAQNVRSTRRTSTTRKTKRTLSSAQVHIFASFNNTIVTVTDQQGNSICWGSAGSAGFKGSRKSTPFAARLAAEQAIKAAQGMGVQEVDMIIKGPGPGRESAIRAVQSTWFESCVRSRISHRCPIMVAGLRKNAACNRGEG